MNLEGHENDKKENKSRQYGRIKGIYIAVLGLAAGAAMIFAGSIFENKNQRETEIRSDEASLESSILNGDENEYISSLENSLENMIAHLTGNQDVSVMLTSDGSFEYVYARDIQSSDVRRYVIVKNNLSGQSGILIKRAVPRIKGAAVVCSCPDAGVQNEIIQLVSSLFDLPTNHIYVGLR